MKNRAVKRLRIAHIANAQVRELRINMPSITYIEENGSGNDADRDSRTKSAHTPEPPARYDANSVPPVKPERPIGSDEMLEYRSARNLVTAAQIMALVSLLIGGVVLSAASMVVAIAASRKIKQTEPLHENQMLWQALKRASTIAIVMAVLALAANVVALIVIYPMVVDAIQSGEYASLFSGAPQTQSPSTNTSTWG